MKHRFLVMIVTITAAWVALPIMAHAATVQTVTINETFQNYPASACPQYTDNDTFGPWKVVFTGYGCVRILDTGGKQSLEIQPKAPVPATHSAETHATLITSTSSVDGDFTYEGTVATTKQLRTQPAPNAWETAWVVWNYIDNDHFYYFIPKENGWELGKRDPAYPGGQRFLATGSQPVFSLDKLKQFKIAKLGNTVSVTLDGTEITTFTDAERPYTTGAIGVYTEDAAVRIDNLKLTVPKTVPDPAQPITPPAQPPAAAPSETSSPAATTQAPSSTKQQPTEQQLADTGTSATDIALFSVILLSMSGILIATRRVS